MFELPNGLLLFETPLENFGLWTASTMYERPRCNIFASSARGKSLDENDSKRWMEAKKWPLHTPHYFSRFFCIQNRQGLNEKSVRFTLFVKGMHDVQI